MIIAVLQARMTSSRLPEKVLKPILGKPMLLHEVERLQRSHLIDKLAVATSTDGTDAPIAYMCHEHGIEVFRGSLDDVLDRYYQAAKPYNPDHVVRVTGDCPVIDWRIVDKVIEKHLVEDNDYTSLSPSYPDGLDTEVVKFSTLKAAWENADKLSEREHVTLYIRNRGKNFRLGQLELEQNFSNMRWTVDEPRDFAFINNIFEELYPKNEDFSAKDILNLLEQKPELITINAGIIRNEGLLKSLSEDRTIKVIK